MKLFLIYLALISIVSMIVCIYDKRQAVRHGWRIPELHLLLWSIAGGSVAMYLTMLLIRHKTKHLKFMIGIPLIIIIQMILVLKFIVAA